MICVLLNIVEYIFILFLYSINITNHVTLSLFSVTCLFISIYEVTAK